MATIKDNTKRFSDRVDNYVKYRPSYPDGVVDFIARDGRLSVGSAVADIGSGTGILTEMLLKKGFTAFAVEPNGEMRREAESRLGKYPSFVSVTGSAEGISLGAKSVDCITVAQAFHWFDRTSAAREFERILKDARRVYLIWNKRVSDTDFMREYESILKKNVPEYSEVSHNNVTPEMIRDFIPEDHALTKFENNQSYGWDALIGRLQSSSYTPKRETAEYRALEEKIRDAFDRHSENGMVAFNYVTEVYSGGFRRANPDRSR